MHVSSHRRLRRHTTRFIAVGVVVITVAACGTSPARQPETEDQASQVGQLLIVSRPAIPAVAREFSNPLRGQYEALMQPLFPQANPAQNRYPPWPASSDAGIRVSWQQLQPTNPSVLAPNAPDESKYDFSVIDDALEKAHARGMRLMLRVYSYNSCCDATYPNDTNMAVPEWLAAIPGTTKTLPPPPGSAVRQVVPNWNSAAYLAGFEELLAALGRRYDGDERLSVFEFSGYGDFSENHISYVSTVLKAEGPAPEGSEQELGYYSQFRDQSITIDSIKQLVAANVVAFRHTQVVVTPQNPEIVRQLLAEPVTAELSGPVGIRSDCLGVQEPLPAWAHDARSWYVKTGDPLVAEIKQRLSSAPVITEWCGIPADADRRAYYQKGIHDVLSYHVSMTSSVNFPDRDSGVAMDPELFALWSRANAMAGYRYSVEGVEGSASVVGTAASLNVKWTNFGAAAAFENWVVEYRLVDSAGAVVRVLPSSVDLKSLLGTRSLSDLPDIPASASVTESLKVDLAQLPPGLYTVGAGVLWNQHKPRATQIVDYPPMQLARDGRSADGWYPIATLDLH